MLFGCREIKKYRIESCGEEELSVLLVAYRLFILGCENKPNFLSSKTASGCQGLLNAGLHIFGPFRIFESLLWEVLEMVGPI